MRRTALISMGIIALMSSASVHADQNKHEEKFCTALDTFRTDFKAFQSIGPSSTLQELRDASDKVAKAANDVEKSAGKINTPAAKRFKEVAQTLRQETRSMPESTTIDQARTRIHDNVQNLKQSAHILATESGCAEGAPAAAESALNKVPSG